MLTKFHIKCTGRLNPSNNSVIKPTTFEIAPYQFDS